MTNEPYARSIRTFVRMSLVVLGAALLAIAAYLWLPAVGAVSPKALDYSVAREAGGTPLLGTEPCRRRPGRAWRCSVYDTSGSGRAAYRVEMTGSRCWQARKDEGSSGEEQPLPRSVSGCVGIRDQLRIVERLLD
jgi:hypothetical protein